MWSVLNAPDKGNGCDRFLIFGASKSGKTSVAFKLSYDVAAQGSTVLFVCRQSNIQNTFPSFMSVVEILDDRGHPPSTACLERSFWSPIVLSRIQFKYVKNAAEMKRLFASLHMMHPPPQCIVVDDFTLLIDPLSAVSRQDTTFLELCQVLGKPGKVCIVYQSHVRGYFCSLLPAHTHCYHFGTHGRCFHCRCC